MKKISFIIPFVSCFLTSIFFGVSILHAQDAGEESLPPIESGDAPVDVPIEENTPTEPTPTPNEPSAPNLQEDFQDPFANPAPETPVEAAPPAVEEPPALPQIEPPTESPALPTFNAPAPTPEPDPTPMSPSFIDPAPQPSPVQPMRNRPFEFPQPGGETGSSPVLQDVVTGEQRQRATPSGTFSMFGGGGIAFNMRNSKNQSLVEVGIGYRLDPQWELALSPFARFHNNASYGTMLGLRYFWRLTDPNAFRIELAPRFDLGWLIRKRTTKFNEHRLFYRLGSDLYFYATPSFSIFTSVAFEMVYYSAVGGKATNVFKGKGPPMQAPISAGVRFEF